MSGGYAPRPAIYAQPMPTRMFAPAQRLASYAVRKSNVEETALKTADQVYDTIVEAAKEAKLIKKKAPAFLLGLAALVPAVIFCTTCGFSCLYVRYQTPVYMYIFIAIGIVLTVGTAFKAFKVRNDPTSADEMNWWGFVSVLCLAALISGVVTGDWNYWYLTHPYYDSLTLQHYEGVDPSLMNGNQVMDAGRILFTEGSYIDLRKSMGFKNIDWYCVAPITTSEKQLSSYDFWAVGLNCCSGAQSGSDFQCGEFNNMNAHAGLRLMRDEQRPYFRLAVQQAQSAFKIEALHPLFFYWLQDPFAEINQYRDDGYKYYFLSCAIFIFIDWVLTILFGIWVAIKSDNASPTD